MNQKVISLALGILVGILILIGVILVIGAMQTNAEVDPETQQVMTDIPAVSNSVSYTMILFWISAALIGIFTVWSIIQNPKRFIPAGIGVAVFGVLILIASAMVTVEKSGYIMTLNDTTEGSLYWGGLGIQATFVLTAVAVLLILIQAGAGIFRYFQK